MKNEKKIEELLRSSLKPENPSLDFTDRLMNKITNLETKEEKALQTVLKRDLIEEPSINFTDRVMAQLSPVAKLVQDKPIISKKVWILISVVFSAIFISALFGVKEEPQSESIISKGLAYLKETFSFSPDYSVLSPDYSALSADLPALSISPIFALGVFALSSLLFVDYLIKKKSVSVKI